jgi:hypothetical protein
MPLYSKDESVVGAFDSFDQSIFRGGVHDKSSPDRFDGLMVGRVDHQGAMLEDSTEAGSRVNFYGMAPSVLDCSEFVLAGVWELGSDILVQSAA